ncbi:exo-beta-N-acetylmuramidase NamZ domain-containing protein [Aquimarina sp. W85]|uniref:exo-beta-N-acetylmuramidase NamZ family protein n=1 Tax=Aquimarina rhodophyticola TaxID=3342246 RepID=UPI00366E020F
MVFIKIVFKNTFLFALILFISCGSFSKPYLPTPSVALDTAADDKLYKHSILDTVSPIIVGANQLPSYLPMLNGKKVALVANQTSVVFGVSFYKKHMLTAGTLTDPTSLYVHLADTLLSHKVNIVKVFSPEHGFRGKADAGEKVADGKDSKTGLPVVSLYGANKKPSKASLKDVEIVIFDIQDVGVRFYTYISTLHYVMQACAENNIPVIILDRPNPNGSYVDGPTLENEQTSFLGMHPVPLVHGMTIGEYANMINTEGWLGTNLTCDLTVVPVKNYTHSDTYSLPIRPSPNLPNDIAINLYPSLGLFEGTTINAGRGTEMQFQIYGSPDLKMGKFNYAYVPHPNFGSKSPKHNNKVCYGENLTSKYPTNEVNLQWLIKAYTHSNNPSNFFKTKSFTLHAGTKKLQEQIERGVPLKIIRKSWESGIELHKQRRKKYALYPI